MAKSLHVLVVEDSENDALLMMEELRKGDLNPVYERFETAAAMATALQDKSWDLIIADYVMPGSMDWTP